MPDYEEMLRERQNFRFGSWLCSLLAILLIGAMTPLTARSWGDLDEGEQEIYGREREEKLPIRFFVVQKEQWKDHYSFHFFFLWASKDYPRYQSGRFLPFYYWLESKIDNRYLLLTPVYHREIDLNDRDESALYLAYWGSHGDSQKKYSALAPLYYYSTYRDASPFLLTPLFWYSRRNAESTSSTSIGIPIIPLIIWDSSPAEWDLIFFYLMRHRARPETTLSHIVPLYYYNRYSAEGSYFISPLYYADTKPGVADRSLLWLIYWGHNEALSEKYHAVFPLYYYASNGASDATLLSPLYWNIKGDKSHFELLIPLYLSYQKKNYSLHVNATGLSFSEDRPSTLPFGVQIKDNKVFVDSDIGWFYNLFRISSRTRIGSDAKAKISPDTIAPAVKPQVTNERARNRDDSENFFGVYSLFGVFAYERADHYRHFRLLPLSWLTWDSKDDTGIQTFLPFYINYKDETARYFVVGAVLPFYGQQQKFHAECTSEISTWFVILYWNEFDCETQMAEKTVLWPIVNHYASPAKGGYRIFPLFWKKWWAEGNTERQVHFSPLHYTQINGDTFSTISWLFYRSRDTEASTFGIWALFHRSHAHKGNAATTFVLPFYYSTNEYKSTEPSAATRRDSLFTFAAVFWRYNETHGDDDSFTMHLSPLYLYFGEKQRSYFFSWLYYQTETAGHKTRGIPVLFHRRNDTDASYSNFYLIPFYYSHEHRVSEKIIIDETVTWLFPLFYRRASGDSSKHFILGYYFERRPGFAFDNFLFLAGRKTHDANQHFSWNALAYTVWYEREQKETHFRLGYGLLFNYSETPFTFNWHLALVTGYKYLNDGSYSRHHLIPLWWHSRNGTDTNLYVPILFSMFTNHDNGNRLFRAVLLGALYYHNSDAAAYEQTEHALFGILYFHNKYPERHFDSYGSVWGGLWHYETENNYKRFSVGMFLYIRTETEAGVKHRLLGIPL